MGKKLIIAIIVIFVILVGVAVFFANRTTENQNNVEQSNTDNSQNNIDSRIYDDDENTTTNESIANSNQNNSQENNQDKERNEDMKLYIKVNNRTLTATLSDNSSVDALVEKLEKGPLTINMSDYADMEKVGTLGFSLPRNDEQISTGAGDLILYQGNSFVIYYDHNNWNFTRLGKIDDISQRELKDILGSGSVTVTLSIEE